MMAAESKAAWRRDKGPSAAEEISMAAPYVMIVNEYDNSYQRSNPITGNGYNVANAKDPQPAIVVTLADASTITIPAGHGARVLMTGAKAFSSMAQAAANAEAGGDVLTPLALQN
jgi:hypothetical protein